MLSMTRFDEKEYIKIENLQSFFLTLILFLLGWMYWGWWTDSYQNMFDFFKSGEVNDMMLPTGDSMPEYMPGGNIIFTFLNKYLHVRWGSFFLISLQFISFFLIYRIVIAVSRPFSYYGRIVLIFLFSLFLIESVVLYHMVRVTMFLGISSLLTVIYFDEKSDWDFKKKLPYLLLFSLAMWIRSSVHLFVLVFLVLVFCVHSRKVKLLLPFLIIFFASIGFYFKTVFFTDYSNNLHFSFLYDWEFKMHFSGDFKVIPDLSYPGDSIRYNAIKHGIISDEINLNQDFYSRIKVFRKHSLLSVEQFSYAWKVFKFSLMENIYFLIIDLFLVISYLVFKRESFSYFRLKTIFLFLAFYLLLFAICFIKMENRFMVPFQVFFLLLMLIFHKPAIFYDSRYVVLLVFIGVGMSFFTFRSVDSKIKTERNNSYNYKSVMDYCVQNYSNSILVFNGVINPVVRPYEVNIYRNDFKKMYYYNYHSLSLSPTLRPYLEKECSCNVGEFYPFYKFLKTQNSKLLFIDNPSRIAALQDYLYFTCNDQFEFSLINVPENINICLAGIGHQGENKLYTLKRN